MRKKLILNILLIFVSLPLFAFYTEDDLVNLMKTNSQSVKSSELSVEKAKKERQKAIGDMLPKIEYNATAAYIANPIGPINISADSIIEAIGLPSASIGNLKPGTYVPVYGGMENSYYSFSLNLTQPIVTWGKLTKQYQIYDSLWQLENDKHSLKLKKDEAEIRARSASYAYLATLEDILSEASEDAALLESLVSKTQNEGMSTRENTLSSISVALHIENAYLNAKAEKTTQVESLGLLTGLYNLSNADLNVSMPSIEEYSEFLRDNSEMSLIASAISSDKEAIKMLNRNIQIQSDKKYVSYASLPYAPDLALVANLSYGGSRFPFAEIGWSSKDDWNAIIALRLQGTLFNGTKKIADVEEAKASLEQANLEKETAVQTIINNVKSMRRSLEASLSSIEYKEAVQDEKAESFRVASEKYENRQISQIDYLTASLEYKGAEADVYTEYIKAATIYNTLKFLAK